MNLLELLDDLQKFSKRKISQVELGEAMGNLKRQTVNTRIKNDSEVTVRELLSAQEYLNVEIYVRTDEKNRRIIKNSLERHCDKTVKERFERFGWRLGEIQDKHEYLDKDMARLLNISEIEYIYLKCGDANPDIKILNRLKECFEVSIDWLLYGD